MIDRSTASVKTPGRLIDRVIGQDKAVRVIRLAARQRRFVLLVGEPGTGKSMLGRSMAELLEVREKKAIVVLPNKDNPIFPIVREMSGEEIDLWEQNIRLLSRRERFANGYLIFFGAFCLILVSLWFFLRAQPWESSQGISLWGPGPWGYVLASFFGLILLWHILLKKPKSSHSHPGTKEGGLSHLKVLYRPDRHKPPFVEATGFSEGALFGDVRHDPYQSGGSETPPHLLVEPGAVHKAHGGVLYIDEIGTLSVESQRLLLTAIQEKALPITGRHQGSSGTLIATGPVPCDFVLVAAGNHEDMAHLLPALRSRILGYGYEVTTVSTLPDRGNTHELVARFIAQEVANDGKIPHFSAEAVESVYRVARDRSPQAGLICARWRELGGVIRIAGDLAVDGGAPLVLRSHVEAALELNASPDRVLADPASSLHPRGQLPLDGHHHLSPSAGISPSTSRGAQPPHQETFNDDL